MLDRLADPYTAVILSIVVVLVFGEVRSWAAFLQPAVERLF